MSKQYKRQISYAMQLSKTTKTISNKNLVQVFLLVFIYVAINKQIGNKLSVRHSGNRKP